MKASNAVNSGLDSRLGEINDWKLCCFSIKQTTVRVKNND